MVVYSVTQVNNQVKQAIESKLSNIHVKGEVTSCSTYPSGHTYFTLSDNKSELSAVIFHSKNNNIETGDNVVIKGSLNLYTAKGRYQLVVQEIIIDGEGELLRRYERLKNKLQIEGLFDSSNKLNIPKLPQKIGLITSEKGAVIWDMLSFFKVQKVNLCFIINHCNVQGKTASGEIIEAINNLTKLNVDLIIIARGGGSVEDLSCFNEEILIRTISGLKIPVISAIGHETDFTLCDFVSDYRAPTPSYAAEYICRNYQNVLLEIDTIYKKLIDTTINKINILNQSLKNISIENSLILYFQNIINLKNNNKLYKSKLLNWIQSELKNVFLSLSYFETNFKVNHPKNSLKKGFAMVEDVKNKNIITGIESLKINQNILINFHDGFVISQIKEIKKNEK